MNHYSLKVLEDMYQDTIEAYEAALDDWMLDDEEHDRIEQLRHDLEEIEAEISQRKKKGGGHDLL